MSKEALRQKTLSYSKEDLNACKKSVLSSSLIKKLQQRFLFLIGIFFFVLLFILYLLLFILNNKPMVVAQLGESTEIAYPIFIGLYLLFIFFLVWGIIKGIINYKRIKNESIAMMKVGIEHIEYCITNNKSRAPYLKVKSLQFGPILPLKSITDIFDSDISYLFYYSSKSKTLLAVSEQHKAL